MMIDSAYNHFALSTVGKGRRPARTVRRLNVTSATEKLGIAQLYRCQVNQ